MVPVQGYTVLIAVGLLSLVCPAFSNSPSLPLRYSVTTLPSDGDSCPREDEQVQLARSEIGGNVSAILSDAIVPNIREPTTGYGSCDCGGPGWNLIAYLNMTDPTQQCPSQWNLITSGLKRSCGRTTNYECNSATFSSQGIQYNQVCGRIIGYQKDSTEAFYQYSSNNTLTLNDQYVDGVSVTHGNPREHIWTFAAGTDESGSVSGGDDISWYCPCITVKDSSGIMIPPFIGNDYFCESGTEASDWPSTGHVYYDDPLWDGQGCGTTTNCCAFNTPPWFCKDLAETTTNDLEVRICSKQEITNEDTYVELIEIYVQ